MCFYRLLLLLAITVTPSAAQIDSSSVAFPSSAGTPNANHFAIEGPSFPQSDPPSDRPSRPLHVDSKLGKLPYAHPVPQPDIRHLFVIAFKDRTVTSALTCRVDGRTLYYVDLQNQSRSVPVSHVDWKHTEGVARH